ncbi:putative oxidoreductase [Angulomicrobium tetraedrale]|uniref:Putative oxidoreductase n=1 Tax=Ancylobacter tetraedralis TaxID=217068 RepID=A0A839Z7L7_9HYPH|nr:DoxX family protein [Ancylobacter tetraedralis]MBB3770710.1 putative oxidoreductase [Ancylobacter tetraedralis]
MIDKNSAPYGVFLLRVALGGMWVSHALLKYVVFTIPGFAGYLGSLGFSPALAWPVFLMELTGGILILLGVYARHVALLLIPVMVAASSAHIGNGWVFSAAGGGWEYPAFLVVTSFALWLIGDGAFALRSRPLLFAGRPVSA